METFESPQGENDIQDHDSDILPGYTTAVPFQRQERPPTEHLSTLRDDTDHAWISFIMNSRAASQSAAPRFTEGQPVEGRVLVDLIKPKRIESIIVTIMGQIICNLDDISVFYSESKTLWKVSDNGTQSSSLLGFGRPKSGPESMLGGKHDWSFSFLLPHELQTDRKSAKENNLKPVELLPPSLNGKGRHSSIVYEVTLDVKRSGYFRGNSTLSHRFIYTPISKPGPASALRSEAYADGSEPLGPSVDVEGWRSLPDFQIRGTLFHVRPVFATCTFALATPCSFARGSTAPCYLTIRSEDPQALELLSTPRSPIIQMRRKLKYKFSKSTTASSGSIYAGVDENTVLSIAVWKKQVQEEPSLEGSLYQSHLYGELSLPKHLVDVPSFSFGDFEVKYVVEVHPFEVVGFMPASQDILLRTEIGITSHYEDGVRPRAYLPPGYIADRELNCP